jgi:hypothetical protein
MNAFIHSLEMIGLAYVIATLAISFFFVFGNCLFPRIEGLNSKPYDEKTWIRRNRR